MLFIPRFPKERAGMQMHIDNIADVESMRWFSESVEKFGIDDGTGCEPIYLSEKLRGSVS